MPYFPEQAADPLAHYTMYYLYNPLCILLQEPSRNRFHKSFLMLSNFCWIMIVIYMRTIPPIRMQSIPLFDFFRMLEVSQGIEID